MATHSIVLAWEMPWTEEPGGLQSKSHKESDMAEHAHACTHTHTHTHTHSVWNSACPTVAIRWCQPSLLPPTVQVCTFQGHVCTVITRHPAPGILESLLSEGMKDTCTPTWNWPGSRASHVDTGPMAAQMIQAFMFHCQRLELEYTGEKDGAAAAVGEVGGRSGSPSQAAPAGCPTTRSF